MKCGIVITLVLALIYCFEIGKTSGLPLSQDPHQMKERTESIMNHLLGIYESYLNETSQTFSSKREKEKKFVNETVIVAITNIQKYAADNNKARNKKAEDCIDSATERLKVAAFKFFESFDNTVDGTLFKTKNKVLIPTTVAGDLVITTLDNIIKGINQTTTPDEALRAVFSMYVSFRMNAAANRKNIPKRFHESISEVSIMIPHLKKMLNNEVQKIYKEAKECIEKVRNIKRKKNFSRVGKRNLFVIN